jgi:hypothetical protein
MSASDRHLFPGMKQNQGGHKFKEDSEMGTAIGTMADKERRSAFGNRE